MAYFCTGHVSVQARVRTEGRQTEVISLTAIVTHYKGNK